MDDSAIITGFRGASAIAYLLDVICSIVFMASGGYLGVIIALYTITIAMFVFVSVIQQPSSMVEKMNNHTEFIFTFKGRFIVDVFLALFLFGMGGFGVAMGIITLLLIIGIRLLAASFPGAFEELFRQGGPSNDNFDTPYGDTGFAPQPSADL
ncbi:hypothetical protein TrVE_jg2819 [Triparma verrucosa]|uniref:Uncharacterized protein n=2 Tax=Triparma TaxID=722752 RepID=A0A9W7C4R2_9STRA|nr:hypothetical protein TrVE_jg2819 [Triparma verrucosa]GMI02193.1 hypothetical protein TrST_g14265 [Triparma strigata]